MNGKSRMVGQEDLDALVRIADIADIADIGVVASRCHAPRR